MRAQLKLTLISWQRWRFNARRFRAWFQHSHSDCEVEKIPKPEGRRRLIAANYSQLKVGSHPNIEIWAKPDGLPVTVPCAGDFYDREALEAILKGE